MRNKFLDSPFGDVWNDWRVFSSDGDGHGCHVRGCVMKWQFRVARIAGILNFTAEIVKHNKTNKVEFTS